MPYNLGELCKIGQGHLYGNENVIIDHLLIDSRSVIFGHNALFIAIQGALSDGHQFIQNAYEKGVRSFMVTSMHYDTLPVDANYIVVENCVFALQQIAKYHRGLNTNTKVIAITGSSGKTTVKEWLSSMLSEQHYIVKSPKSYNSQIGVPLSVWHLDASHEIALFEAGISTKGEMHHLADIIQPHIGIFTNIGHAHDAGFDSMSEKINEKIKLFISCQTIICCADHIEIYTALKKAYPNKHFFTWGSNDESTIRIQHREIKQQHTDLSILAQGESHTITLPIVDTASFENLMHCISTLSYFNYGIDEIRRLTSSVLPIEMRLQLKQGRSSSLIVNDAYINDPSSLQFALEYMSKHAGERKKIVILSPFAQAPSKLMQQEDTIKEMITLHRPDMLLLVGDVFQNRVFDSKIHVQQFQDTSSLKSFLSSLNIHQSIVLLKGSRKFQFEQLEASLMDQSHTTTLSIDLSALEHNLSVYASLMKPSTSLICVIKAGAYGSGSSEIASILQYKGVSYLAVAFADEGVHLRKCGITIPIMVLNPDANSLQEMVKYHLEPEVYDLIQLKEIINFLQSEDERLNIHLKLDTGMSRLGFKEEDLDSLITLLAESENVNVKTVFSHLSSSEDRNDDTFTHAQAKIFQHNYDIICQSLNIQPKRHLLNSGGIQHFPAYQFDYVRLGIGMYGIEGNKSLSAKLEKVHTLTAKIIQIKNVKIGDYVGYNRSHVVDQASRIAILNIGYADGLKRACGKGKYQVMVNGKLAPIIGNVCMDLTIIDISHIEEVKHGDLATIFGKDHPIEALAQVCGTIPYEILTSISQRIRREFLNG